MFCPNCGKEINSGQKYCMFCGTKIPEMSQKEKTYDYLNDSEKYSYNENETGVIVLSRSNSSRMIISAPIKIVVDGEKYGTIKQSQIENVKLSYGYHTLEFYAGMNLIESINVNINENNPRQVYTIGTQNENGSTVPLSRDTISSIVSDKKEFESKVSFWIFIFIFVVVCVIAGITMFS